MQCCIRITRRVTLEIGYWDMQTDTCTQTTRAFLPGDKLVIAEVADEGEEETTFVLLDESATTIPNDAWVPVKVSERDAFELAHQCRAEGEDIKPLPISIGLFVELHNDRTIEDLGAFLAYDDATVKDYKRAARRLGYKLRKRRRPNRLSQAEVEALNARCLPRYAVYAGGEGGWTEVPLKYRTSPASEN